MIPIDYAEIPGGTPVLVLATGAHFMERGEVTEILGSRGYTVKFGDGSFAPFTRRELAVTRPSLF